MKDWGTLCNSWNAICTGLSLLGFSKLNNSSLIAAPGDNATLLFGNTSGFQSGEIMLPPPSTFLGRFGKGGGGTSEPVEGESFFFFFRERDMDVMSKLGKGVAACKSRVTTEIYNYRRVSVINTSTFSSFFLNQYHLFPHCLTKQDVVILLVLFCRLFLLLVWFFF